MNELVELLQKHYRDACREADGPPACLWPDGSLRRSAPNCEIPREKIKETLDLIESQAAEIEESKRIFKRFARELGLLTQLEKAETKCAEYDKALESAIINLQHHRPVIVANRLIKERERIRGKNDG